MTAVQPALRTGSTADLDAVLALLDGAVRWLVAQGRTGQWGDQPWSASEAAADSRPAAMSCSSI